MGTLRKAYHKYASNIMDIIHNIKCMVNGVKNGDRRLTVNV